MSVKKSLFFYSKVHGYSYNKVVITPLFNRVFTQLKGGLKNKQI